MFGNRMVYYHGGGGVRRGLIWQSGQEKKVEPVPEKDGFLIIPEFWGGIPYGNINKVSYASHDDPPVINEWRHDASSNLIFDRTNSCFRFDWSEWDNKNNTPSDVLNASSWLVRPFVQPTVPPAGYSYDAGVDWCHDVPHHIPDSLSYYAPTLAFFPYSDGSAATAAGSLVWADDTWATAGFPFSYLYHPEYTEGYMLYDFERLKCTSVLLFGISNKTFSVRNAFVISEESNYRYFNFKIVKKALIKYEKTSGKTRGDYVVDVSWLPVPEWAIGYNP